MVQTYVVNLMYSLPSIPTMMSPEEIDYLHRHCCNLVGRGAVVEAGAWLGASSRAIIDGVRGRCVHHVFDRFLWQPNFEKMFPHMAGRFKIGQSLIPAYYANIGYINRDQVILYPGELEWYTWDQDIEFLFLDILKTLQTVVHAAFMFFPWLMEGAVIMEQDFRFAPAHVASKYPLFYGLREYLEVEDKVNTSVTFRVKKRMNNDIIGGVIADNLSCDGFYLMESLKYFAGKGALDV